MEYGNQVKAETQINYENSWVENAAVIFTKLLRCTRQTGASDVFGVLSEFLRMRIISVTY